jgi:hypothetical protein
MAHEYQADENISPGPVAGNGTRGTNSADGSAGATPRRYSTRNPAELNW